MSDNFWKVKKLRFSEATSKATDTYLEAALKTVKTFGLAECNQGSVISALIIASAILNAEAFNDIVECEK